MSADPTFAPEHYAHSLPQYLVPLLSSTALMVDPTTLNQVGYWAQHVTNVTTGPCLALECRCMVVRAVVCCELCRFVIVRHVVVLYCVVLCRVVIDVPGLIS